MSVFSEIRARLATTPAGRPGDDPGDVRNRAGTAVATVPAPSTAASSASASSSASPVTPEDFALTDAQKTFFDTFGFLVLRGLFAAEMGAITDEFERVFAEQTPWESHEDLHFNEQRLIVPNIIDHSPMLLGLLNDPRITRIVAPILGGDYIGGQSDGSLFSCETSWHADTFGAPMEQRHVKISFYLESLDIASGAIRVIPGTNHYITNYARGLRRDLNDPARIESILGVAPAEIPSWTVHSAPGDIVVWDFRTIHASFNGSKRRRLLSLNFKERLPDAAAPTA